MLEGRDWHPFLITTGGTGSSRQPFTWVAQGQGTALFWAQLCSGPSFVLCPKNRPQKQEIPGLKAFGIFNSAEFK